MRYRLNGKRAFITGTNRGIGLKIVESFAKEGVNIVAHARKYSKLFEDKMKEISKENGVEIDTIYFDMSDVSCMKDSVKKLIGRRREIDILVNNAGVAHGGLFQMTAIDDIKKVFEVNLFGMMQLTQLLIRSMLRNGGAIINMASISGIELREGNCAYGVSKAGVIAFTKTLSAELASHGIRVNAVAPGLTDTDMATLMEKKAGINMVRETAMGRLAKPEEIAETVLFLASENASFISGQTIRVDGGEK